MEKGAQLFVLILQFSQKFPKMISHPIGEFAQYGHPAPQRSHGAMPRLASKREMWCEAPNLGARISRRAVDLS
jgi:hypothetical protein